jgi:hypothetical protein
VGVFVSVGACVVVCLRMITGCVCECGRVCCGVLAHDYLLRVGIRPRPWPVSVNCFAHERGLKLVSW